MNRLLLILLLPLSVLVNAQESSGLMAMNTSREISEPRDTAVIRFSNSESPDYTFIINPNIGEDAIQIETTYTKQYKVRFVDYWGHSVKVYRDVYANKLINVEDLKKGIYIMNITDARSHKLLTSQVVNLKRRHL